MTVDPLEAAPRRAPAAARPCELYTNHGSARPSVTEGHHRHPKYLQARVYAGEVRDGELLWLCSTCHDNVHAWLYWLLAERAEPNPWPPARARAEAERAHLWYLAALNRSAG